MPSPRSSQRDAQVVVVGAGPAGSSAAEAASSLGAEVILVDRKAEIGSPVQCGGFLPEAHELRALFPKGNLPQTLVDLPSRCILHRTRLQRLYSPSGRSKEFPVDGRVLDRRSFDRYLAYRAARAGSQICPATNAFRDGDVLRLRGRFSGSLKARVIIGADGPFSGMARSHGVAMGEVGICLQYEMVDVDIDPDAAEMYFGSKFSPGGYAWIIPMGQDVANVGVGVRTQYIERGLRIPSIIEAFIEESPASDKIKRGEVVSVMRGTVPASGTRVLHQGNVLFAGDAAGQVMATSGGGIPLAVVAGSIAGEVAARHVLGQGSLSEYPERIREAFGGELSRSVQIRRMVDLLMRSDKLMDSLFSMIEPEDMKAIQRGQIPGTLGRICRSLGYGGS